MSIQNTYLQYVPLELMAVISLNIETLFVLKSYSFHHH